MARSWSDTQANSPTLVCMELASLLFRKERGAGVRVLMSQRVQISATRFRVPDVIVVLASDHAEPIVRHPPFLCVEILCKLDTPARFNEKLSDNFQMGVRHVWVLDPLARRAYCYTPGEMHEVLGGDTAYEGPRYRCSAGGRLRRVV
jgi:Uma2 family endonuclease